MALISRLPAFCLFWLFSIAVFAQQNEAGVLRIKIKGDQVSGIQKRSLANAQFGISDLDDISSRIGVSSVKRLFREAGKFEEAHKRYGLHLWYEITFDKNTPVAAALSAYRSLSQIDVVEGLERYRAIIPVDRKDALAPASLEDPTDDPLFSQQWHYKNSGQSGGTPGADISLPQAWAVQTGDPEVIVAVIDGGIDISHPDLTASMWVNEDEIPGNSIDDDGNGYVDDVYGYGFGDNTGTIYPHYHGTHVAGTIAAVTNNGVGVSGIAGGSGTGNGVRLMSCAGFGQFGVGGFEDAMVYAADNGAVISQNSWGGGSHAIEDAIDYFIARAGLDNSSDVFDDNIQIGPMAGGIVIFAAGNSNTDNTDIGYPASYPPVMAVASTTHDDEKSYFSNYGDWVDIAAPGSDVLSTYPVEIGEYTYLSGTSMACPHVSGVAALIISQFKGESYHPSLVWDRLQLTADDIDSKNPGYENLLGSGRLNAYQALQVADDIPPSAIADLSLAEAKLNSIVLQWTAPGASGTEGAASYYDIRYSTSPIDDSNFGTAIQISNPPRPQIAGSTELFEIKNLSHSTTYYFAIKAKDFFANVSGLSNIVSGLTLPPPVIEVSPSSLEADLFTGANEIQYITVTNNGASDLFFEVSSRIESPSSLAGIRTGKFQMKQNSFAALNQKKPAEKKYPQIISPLSLPDNYTIQNQARATSRKTLPLTSSGRLFSLNHNTGQIQEIDPASGEVINTISSPESFSAGPDGLAFDGTYLYYINGFGTNAIHRIDPESGEVVSTLQLSLPSIDALAHSGEFVYAQDYSNGVIYEVDFDGGEVVRTLDPDISIGGGISFGGHRGTVFVSNFGTAIYEINLETGDIENTLSVPGTIYGLGYSAGLEILFAANVSTGNTDAIDPDTGEVLYSLPSILSAALASDESGNNWLIPGGDITTVAPGASVELPVELNASGLVGGTYHGFVKIKSNDPATPLVEVPVTLNVTGAPDIHLDPSTIVFEETYIGQQSEIDITIRNAGTDDLHITSVSVSGSGFSEVEEVIDLTPGQSYMLTLSFSPETTGDFSEVLSVVSNDPDEPALSIPVSGKGAAPPVINVTPTVLDAALFTGEMTTRLLTIQNDGGSKLTWNLSFGTGSTPSGTGVSLQYFEQSQMISGGLNNEGVSVGSEITGGPFLTAAGDFVARAPSPVPLTCLASDAVTGVIYGQANQGYAYYKYVPETNTWSSLSSSPLYSGNNGGAVYLNGKIYTIYTGNSSSMGVYTIASDTWSTIANELTYGTGNISTDGTYIYVVSANSFKRYEPVSETWITLETPPFYFNAWGGLSYSDNTIYGHQGDGYTGFAKYDIASGTWSSLPAVPGGAVLGSVIDPVAGKYYTYGSYGGSNLYVFDISENSWEITTIPFFTVYDGGLVLVGKPGVSGIYFIQGESGTGFGMLETSNWIDVNPVSGEILAGEGEEIEITLDATGLFGGVYTGSLTIHSNDPVNTEINVPVTLTVTGAGDIKTGSDNLNFGEVYINTQKDTVLTITNEGTDILSVSSITSDNEKYTVSSTSFDLEPGEHSEIIVSFMPTEVTEENANLVVNSNDPDEATKIISLTGSGVTPPVMEVAPLSIEHSLFTDEVVTKTLVVNNNGGSDLIWNLSLSTAPLTTGNQSTVFFEEEKQETIEVNNHNVKVSDPVKPGTYPLALGDFTTRASSAVPLTCLAADPSSNMIYAQANEGYAFYKYNPLLNEWTTLASSPVHSGNNGGAVYLKGKIYTVYTGNSSLIGVYTIAGNTWTTIENGLDYGTGHITTDGTFLYMAGQYQFKKYDPETGVWSSLATPPFSFYLWGGLSYKDQTIYGHQGNGSTAFAKYNIVSNTWTVLPNVPGGAVLGSAIDPVSNRFYAYGSYGGSNLYAYDLINNSWSVMTIPFFPVNDGGLVYIGKHGGQGIYFIQGELGTGFARVESSSVASWIQIDKISGSITAGGIEEIEVTLDATGLFGGVYAGELVISSNDPVTSEVDIPVTLTVTGVPDIETNVGSLNFGEVYLDTQKDSVIVITNTGTDVLSITAIASDNEKFAVAFVPFDLDPGESKAVTISFTPSVSATENGTLSISSNDPDQPITIVGLTGVGVYPPIIELTPSSLDAALLTGQSTSSILAIANNGVSDLDWNLTIVIPLSVTEQTGIADVAKDKSEMEYNKLQVPASHSWIQTNINAGKVLSGETAEIEVILNAAGLFGGVYDATLTVNSNDPVTPAVNIPVKLTVTGAPNINIDKSAIDFGEVYLDTRRDSVITITNDGAEMLSISAISTDNPKFVVAFTPFELDPGESQTVIVSFIPTALTEENGNLTIINNDPDQTEKIITLTGTAVEPPIRLLPKSLEVSIDRHDNTNRRLTITNSGSSVLNWKISMAGSGFNTLEQDLENINLTHAGISALIPNRYNFSEGGEGTHISDGGGDMYDWGNGLYTNGNSSAFVPYTNGVISSLGSFGPAGRYFTVKHPGLFVMAADVDISSFTIDGNLGADGSGNVDGDVLTITRHGRTFKGFIKRVYNAWDPSVNHLVIVENNESANHQYSTDTNSDYHTVENLAGVNRLYYLLFASGSGGYVDNTAMQNIMSSFLDLLNTGPQWLSVSKTTGTLNVGQSENIVAVFQSGELEYGSYNSSINVANGVPGTFALSVPVVLNITPLPDIQILPDQSFDFEKVYVGMTEDKSISVKNVGNDVLNIHGFSTSNSSFAVTSQSISISPGESANIDVTFSPPTTGIHGGELNILSNDPNESSLEVAVSGTGALPALAEVPQSLESAVCVDCSKVINMKLKNIGEEVMEWSVSGFPSWSYVDVSSGSLDVDAEKFLKITVDAAGLTEDTYSFNLLLNYNHPLNSLVSIPVTMVVGENLAPFLVKTIPDQTLEMESAGISLNLSEYFTDPESEVLKFSIDNADINLLSAGIQGSILSLSALEIGTATVTIKAEDPVGKFVTADLKVVIVPENQAPIAIKLMPDLTIEEGSSSSVVINLSEYFADPDLDPLKFSVENPETGSLDAGVDGAVLSLLPLKTDTVMLSVKAEDPAGAFVSTNLKVTIVPENRSPEIIKSIEDIIIEAGSSSIQINLAEYFSDADNDLLMYSSSATETSVINQVVTGSVLKITPIKAGESGVTVWAEDNKNAKAELGFQVLVTPVTGILHEGVSALQSYPNPFKEKINISYTLPQSGHVTVTMFDMRGAVLRVLVNEIQSSGPKEVPFDAGEIAPGFYFYTLVVDGKRLGINKMIKN